MWCSKEECDDGRGPEPMDVAETAASGPSIVTVENLRTDGGLTKIQTT